MQDSGKPEDAGTAKPEGAEAEETRQPHHPEPREREFGETRKSHLRQSRKVRRAGKPAHPPGGAVGRAEQRRNPKLWPRKRRRMRDARQLEAPSPAKPEDDRTGETRQIVSRRNRKANRGETRSLSAGNAEG